MPQSVGAALARAAQLLNASPTPHADAQILLSFALRVPREWLLAHSDELLGAAESRRFTDLCGRRAGGMPVAYLTGSAGFYGRDFHVTPSTLIPRPETEHIVESAVAHLRTGTRRGGGDRPLRVFDCGVGSGAIACTIAAEIPGALVEGTDISAEAVAVAWQNARSLGVEDRCRFWCADIVPPAIERPYDVVVANLPYIPSADIPRQPDPVGFEPRTALDGGLDGLDAYRKLLRHIETLLGAGGLLLLEAAPPTIFQLLALTNEALCDAAVEIGMDYAGQERFIRAVRSGIAAQQ